jgi:hypothetical protein
MLLSHNAMKSLTASSVPMLKFLKPRHFQTPRSTPPDSILFSSRERQNSKELSWRHTPPLVMSVVFVMFRCLNTQPSLAVLLLRSLTPLLLFPETLPLISRSLSLLSLSLSLSRSLDLSRYFPNPLQECVLAPDASVGGGECLHSLVGPHIGFHHNCLLISSVWPFGRGNLSYGCKVCHTPSPPLLLFHPPLFLSHPLPSPLVLPQVGANHTGRVSDQEHHPGEGCFFGLGVEIKFPSNTLYSPYSLFASGVTCLPQLLTFPFSLISAPDSCGCQLNLSPALNSLKPAWVLYGNPYMLFRYPSSLSSYLAHSGGSRTVSQGRLRSSLKDVRQSIMQQTSL